MATAKVHKREANHNGCVNDTLYLSVGWLLRKYINGKPITTEELASIYLKVLDGYCEGT